MPESKTSPSGPGSETAAGTPGTVAAHRQKVAHSYWVSYPAHPARTSDPHYVDFEAYRNRTHVTAKCAIGEHRADYSGYFLDKPLELHLTRIQFSLKNGADL